MKRKLFNLVRSWPITDLPDKNSHFCLFYGMKGTAVAESGRYLTFPITDKQPNGKDAIEIVKRLGEQVPWNQN